MIRRLLYISTQRLALEPPGLFDILFVSRRNNRRDGLTGLLVAGRKRFLQILEGDPLAVGDAYERISLDPRHYACVVLDDRLVPARSFAGWDMGSVEVDEGEHAESDALARMVEAIGDDALRAQFEGFLAIQSKAA